MTQQNSPDDSGLLHGIEEIKRFLESATSGPVGEKTMRRFLAAKLPHFREGHKIYSHKDAIREYLHDRATKSQKRKRK